MQSRRMVISTSFALAALTASQSIAGDCKRTPSPRLQVRIEVANPQVANLQVAAFQQTYSSWQRYPNKAGVWYSEFTYKVGGEKQKHYLVWYERDRNHCYCFNPDTGKYWGRWNYGGVQITFSRPVAASPDDLKSPPSKITFQGEEILPAVPKTNTLMTPPAPDDLPPV